MTETAAHTNPALERVDLPVEGMTCASCAARIERGLGRIEGVGEARVNFAAQTATVLYDPSVVRPDAFRVMRMFEEVPDGDDDRDAVERECL